MNLIKLFALFMASIAAAAPSAEYSQISVKITNTAAQNHGSVVHSSQELVTNGESPLSDVSFPFTLSASYFGPHGEPPSPSSPKLPFGFFDSGIFPKGVLGAVTVFNFQQGKLRVGDRLALGQHPSQSYYPFTSLVPLSSEYTTFDLVVRLETLEGNRRFFLDFANKDRAWAVHEFHPTQLIFVTDIHGGPQPKIALELLPIYAIDDFSNDANANSSRDVL